MPGAQIYQIKITLRGSKPPIWRRVQVRSNITLAKLNHVIQSVMGWYGYHLHQFIVGGMYFGPPDPSGYMEMKNESRTRLNQIVPGVKFKFVYEYDFGDSWEHVLLVEKILPPEKGVKYPVCVKGKCACPPEDVGGIWGYYAFREAIWDPDHPEREEYLEWIGGEFDPKAFDLNEANAALRVLR